MGIENPRVGGSIPSSATILISRQFKNFARVLRRAKVMDLG